MQDWIWSHHSLLHRIWSEGLFLFSAANVLRPRCCFWVCASLFLLGVSSSMPLKSKCNVCTSALWSKVSTLENGRIDSTFNEKKVSVRQIAREFILYSRKRAAVWMQSGLLHNWQKEYKAERNDVSLKSHIAGNQRKNWGGFLSPSCSGHCCWAEDKRDLLLSAEAQHCCWPCPYGEDPQPLHSPQPTTTQISSFTYWTSKSASLFDHVAAMLSAENVEF